MKLIQKIALRLSIVLIPVIALWAMIFYFVTVEEINDEVDDLLRSYSEQLIAKKLANQELPVADIIAGMHYSISRLPKNTPTRTRARNIMIPNYISMKLTKMNQPGFSRPFSMMPKDDISN